MQGMGRNLQSSNIIILLLFICSIVCLKTSCIRFGVTCKKNELRSINFSLKDKLGKDLKGFKGISYKIKFADYEHFESYYENIAKPVITMKKNIIVCRMYNILIDNPEEVDIGCGVVMNFKGESYFLGMVPLQKSNENTFLRLFIELKDERLEVEKIFDDVICSSIFIFQLAQYEEACTKPDPANIENEFQEFMLVKPDVTINDISGNDKNKYAMKCDKVLKAMNDSSSNSKIPSVEEKEGEIDSEGSSVVSDSIKSNDSVNQVFNKSKRSEYYTEIQKSSPVQQFFNLFVIPLGASVLLAIAKSYIY